MLVFIGCDRWSRATILSCALVSIALAACAQPESAAGKSPAQTPDLGGALLSDPTVGPVYAVLADSFPAEWKTFLSTAEDVLSKGGDLGEAGAIAGEQLDIAMQVHAPAILNAPTEPLLDNLAARTQLIRTLQKENIQFCADYGRGLPLPNGSLLSDQAFADNWAATGAYYKALAAARQTPQRRLVLTAAAQQNFAATLDTTVEALHITTPATSTEPQSICAHSRAYLEALGAIPRDDAATILARDLMKGYDRARQPPPPP